MATLPRAARLHARLSGRRGRDIIATELAVAFFGFDNQNLLAVAIVAVVVFFATASRRPSRRCTRCREINREQAVYCAQCGTRLHKR